MRVHLWPLGFIGQVMAVLLAAITLEFVGSTLLYEYLEIGSVREERARQFAEQIIVADRLLAATAPDQRPDLAKQLTSEHVEISWVRDPVLDETERSTALEDIHEKMLAWETGLVGRDMRLSVAGDNNIVVGTLRLADDTWLYFRSSFTNNPWTGFTKAFLSLSILVLGVLLAAVLVIRSLGTPVRALARAADSIGGEGTPVTISERGSRDLKMVARAFNAMQDRINQLLASRTQMLVAVSHDLRTPLARLRLRAEGIGEVGTREAITGEIIEMEHMLTSVLTYLSGESDPEKPVLTDVAVLAMTLVDAAADAGRNVEYKGPDSLHLRVRSLSIKRALDNLIENAIHYGDRAIVTLASDAEGVHLAVEDEGPGIPAHELAAVVKPFYRLDAARPRNTEGLGLGLAIVDRAMRQEGGELRLKNRPAGGLKAELFFQSSVQTSAGNTL
jgi:two-component system osmolarity sensor histidine kinase EnvZ